MKDKNIIGITTLMKNNSTQYRMLTIGVGNTGNSVIESIKGQGIDGLEYLTIDEQLSGSLEKNLKKTDMAVIVYDSCEKFDLVKKALDVCKGIDGMTTIAVVRSSFGYEQEKVRATSKRNMRKITDKVDVLIEISGERIGKLLKNDGLPDDELKIKSVNEIKSVVLDIKNMVDTLCRSDMRMNFNDLRDALKNKGRSYIGIGEGEGKEKASKAIDQAINNSIMTIGIKGAKSVVISVIGNIRLKDTEIIEDFFLDMFGEDIDILFCITKEETPGDKIWLTLLAAGIQGESGD